MTALSKFVHDKHITLTALAQQIGVSHAQLSRIAAGKSRPSPTLARRIEEITKGEITAATLLGLQPAALAVAQDIGGARWGATLAKGDGLVLSAEALEALGFAAPDVLVIRRDGDKVVITSQNAAIDRVRQELRKRVPPGVSIVDEFIAERRAEAAREDEYD